MAVNLRARGIWLVLLLATFLSASSANPGAAVSSNPSSSSNQRPPADINLDDLPGTPVVDCAVTNLAAPMESCLQGASQLCCAAIDAAFAPGANASTRNCLCLPTVAALGQQVALTFGVDFTKVRQLGMRTNQSCQVTWTGQIERFFLSCVWFGSIGGAACCLLLGPLNCFT